MRAKEFLFITEGVGLARRKPGETFENPQGDKLFFQNLTFFPNVGKYSSPEEREQAIDDATKEKNIHWTNVSNASTLAFGIATFTTDDGKEYYLGRYFKDIKANRNDNDFPHSAIPGGFKYSVNAGAKENAGYKPSQVLTNFKNQTPDSIAQQIIAKFGAGSDEANAVEIFMQSSNFPVRVPKGSMNFEAFKIYFCEMLQPIALIKGMTVSGNAQEAVDIFFGQGATLQDCTITFNDSTGGALSDSVLTNPEGKELKISTKDAVGGGAKASAQNFFKIIEELERAGKTELLNKHKDVMEILNAFKGKPMKEPGPDGQIRFDGKTHYSAPIDIGKIAKLIDENEAQQILSLRGMGLGENPIGQNLLSPKLEEWYTKYLQKWKKPVIPLHTMMLILAYNVTKYVNEKTNFSKSASDILNNSALIQVYNDVVPSDKDFIIRGMRAVYPSNAVTGVRLTTEKAYWTTGAQGNMTFEILYNNESSAGTAPSQPGDAEPATKSAPAPVAPAPVAPTPSTTSTSTIAQTGDLSKGVQNQQKTMLTKHQMGQEPESEPADTELAQVKKNAGLQPAK